MMPNVSFNRVYMFSSAHRLHSSSLTDRENIQIYDKCNNYNGHGHDYKVEVSVKGPLHPLTGMVIPLPELDNLVADLLKTLDHKHLDNELPFFRENHSSGEVIIQYLWDELNKRLPDRMLHHIKLWETNNNYFEIAEEN